MIYLRSIFWWGYIASTVTFLWFGAVIVWASTFWWDRQRRLLHRYTCWWAHHYLIVGPPWSLKAEGRELIDRKGTYILVANHQSLADILVCFAIHRHFKWVSKAGVFQIPFLGWNMAMNQYVRLDRGNPNSIAEMMTACSEHLKEGSSIMVFPEGTRSRDGKLKPFKHGAFTLSVENKVPVVPIVIEGTKTALPKDGFWFRDDAVMSFRVLPPIDPASVDYDRDRLAQKVKMAIAQALSEIRNVPLDEVIRSASEPSGGASE